MNIAAYISFKGHPFDDMLFTAIVKMAETKHGNNFTVISTKENFEGITLPANVDIKKVKLPGNNWLKKYWFNVSLPKLIKQLAADIFIAEPNFLKTKILSKQYAWIAFEMPERNKDFEAAKNVAEKFIAVNESVALELKEVHKIPEEKISIVYHGLNENIFPLNFKDIQKVQEQYTGGDNYFLLYSSKNTHAYLREALKAYTVFKKWQKSSFKIVILLDGISATDAVPDIGGYKYKDDVVFLSPKTEEEYFSLISSSFANIYLANIQYDAFCLNSLQAGVPLITLDSVYARAAFGNAAAYAYNAYTGIADVMMAVYKGENLCAVLVENGKKLIEKYNWESSSGALSNAMHLTE